MATFDELRAETNGLISRIVDRLPNTADLSSLDLKWLYRCDEILEGAPTNDNIMKAIRRAVGKYPEDCECVDPYKLAIASGVCDGSLSPLP